VAQSGMDVKQLVTMAAINIPVAVSTVNCYHQQFKLMLRAGYGSCSRGRQADVAVCCPLLS